MATVKELTEGIELLRRLLHELPDGTARLETISSIEALAREIQITIRDEKRALKKRTRRLKAVLGVVK